MDNIENPYEDLLYKIAISLVPVIGSITAKSLIAYCGVSGNLVLTCHDTEDEIFFK